MDNWSNKIESKKGSELVKLYASLIKRETAAGDYAADMVYTEAVKRSDKFYPPFSEKRKKARKAYKLTKGKKGDFDFWLMLKAEYIKALEGSLCVYDNKGESLDRYTIVNLKEPQGKQGHYNLYSAISASENGAGFFMHIECTRGSFLGEKIPLEMLSNDLLIMIANNK